MSAASKRPRQKKRRRKPRSVPFQPRPERLTRSGGFGAGLAMARGYPVVQLGQDEIGYCMNPARPDSCLSAALATATQIPVEQVPDLKLDKRLQAGEDAETISRESWARIAKWLDSRGLRLVFHDAVPVDRERWVGVIRGALPDSDVVTQFGLDLGRANNPFLDHCLVMSHGRVVFDPAISLSPQLPSGVRLPRWRPSQVEYGLSFGREE